MIDFIMGAIFGIALSTLTIFLYACLIVGSDKDDL